MSFPAVLLTAAISIAAIGVLTYVIVYYMLVALGYPA
jgi:hypothetical protein